MKTVKKGFSRGLSVLLTLVMVLSLTVVGMVSSSAARVDIADSGWYSGDKFYVNANINSYNDIDPMTFVSEGSGNDTGYFTQTFTTTQKYFEFRVKLNGGTYLVPKQSPYEIAPTENTEGSLWTQTDTRGNHDGRIYKLNCSSIKSDKIDVTINVKISGGSVKDLTYKVVSSGGSGGGETTTMRTFTAGEMLYIVNGKPADSWGANWVASDANVKITLINSKTHATTTTDNVTLVSGETYAAGAVYGASIPNGGEYDQIKIERTSDENNKHSTGAMTLSANDNYNCFADFTVNGKTYKGSVYDPSVVVVSGFYVDMTPDDDTFTDDHIKPTVSGSNYTLYLPSGIDRDAVTIKHDYTSLTIGGKSITSGQTVSLSNDSYALGGDITGTLRVYKSKNVSSIHTTTEIPMPQGIKMNNPVTNKPYDNKENYSTSGTIVVFDKNGNQLNTDINLKKIKGRGNSSWEASYKVIGKYAFNITLAKGAKLLDESAKAKKYCLVSYNADEARMRNMVVYELAQQIGLMFSPDYEPVDLYNNGVYVGSYLLTDKVEIGNPLVNIVDLEDANETANPTIYAKDYDISQSRGSSNGNIKDNSTKGYTKWVNMTEIEESVYAKSGFLLEFELNERFADEISGFISGKGQQIVVKYPEYTSKNQIDFISEKWNIAEALMYDKSTTYEALSAVIDVESFARMYLIQEFTKNLDGCATSYYVYYDEGRFHAGPAWDYDWTLGQYAKTYTDRVNQSSVHNSYVNADPSNSDGWYMNSKTIYGASTLNAQAALCQNKAFWGAVKAEWNESFYDAVSAFTTGTVSATNGLTGTLAEFYDQVKYSTAMDEAKWGLIAANKMVSWGSKDTGDSHDAATIFLNNWIYNRLQWMDNYLDATKSQKQATDIYKVDYVIQPPKVTADKAEYNLGDPVVLTIDDVTGGAYTYTIYKDGKQIATSQEGPTFTTTATTTADYTVVATSKGWSGYSSAASNPATVTVGGFQAAITNVEIPQSAMVGEKVTVKVTSNAANGDAVTYTLKDSTGKDIAPSNSTGVFTFEVTEAMISEKYTVKVGVSITANGETTTAFSEHSINISDYTMTLTLSAPGSAEVNMDVEIKASANTTKPVTYTLYGSDDTTVLDTNSTGIFTVNIGDTADVTLTYKVKAQLDGDSTKSAEKTVDIKVTAVSETYKVVLYFKSSDSLGYIPQLTTTGATENTDGAVMIRDEFICKNVSKTASYSWYTSGELEVSKAKDRLIVNIVSSRYAMEGELTLTPSSYLANDKGVIEIYLACDNLNYNAGGEIRDLTSWPEEKRNWTQSAANMIYDEKEVSEATYAAVASMIAPRYIGDVNNDGVVNVKDATLLQKSIAGTATLDADSRYISDVFYDGTISVKDATAIQKRVVNL